MNKENAIKLSLKDLVNRFYAGNDPVSFEYYVRDDSGRKFASFRWQRLDERGEGVWLCILQFEGDSQRQVKIYRVEYKMPPLTQLAGIPLVVIAIVGMKAIQSLLKESVQEESAVDFLIGTFVGETGKPSWWAE